MIWDAFSIYTWLWPKYLLPKRVSEVVIVEAVLHSEQNYSKLLVNRSWVFIIQLVPQTHSTSSLFVHSDACFWCFCLLVFCLMFLCFLSFFSFLSRASTRIFERAVWYISLSSFELNFYLKGNKIQYNYHPDFYLPWCKFYSCSKL